MKTKRQVGPTFAKKEWAEEWKNQTLRADEGEHHVAAPWDVWTVEPVEYGFAVFVTADI